MSLQYKVQILKLNFLEQTPCTVPHFKASVNGKVELRGPE